MLGEMPSLKSEILELFNNEMEKTLNLENDFNRKGKNTKLKRSNHMSEKLAREFILMRRLQLDLKNKNKERFVFNVNQLHETKSLNTVFQHICTSLTKKIKSAQSSCLQNPCNTFAPYRSIDGCCNNVHNPSFGKIYHRLKSCKYVFSLARHAQLPLPKTAGP